MIIFLLISIYILSAFVLSRVEIKGKTALTNDVTIYIMTNGVHTDIVVPVKNAQIDWSKEIKYENTVRPDITKKYLALGWGDKGFYLETPTWADLKFCTAFKAAFGINTTAIHATFYSAVNEGKSCKRICLSKKQYCCLINFIQKSFKKDVNGHYQNIRTRAYYSESDAFYEAVGRYNLFYTCNTWTNNGLKACGQKACLWTPYDKGIFYHYNKK